MRVDNKNTSMPAQEGVPLMMHSLLRARCSPVVVRRFPILVGCLLLMAVCLSTACSSFKELSFFKSKSSSREMVRDVSSMQTRLLGYSEILQWDSSSFNAWIWVDGDFSFHQDSGIKGEKALIQYVGKSNSLLQLKDSLIAQHDSSNSTEYSTRETNFIKTKEKRRWGYSWLLWIGAGFLVLWVYYRSSRKNSLF